MQIQNIPRGKEVKSTLVADDDFLLYEADYSAAESRGTGYLAGCEAIINNVEGPHDFHSLNASAFFGIPYENIYDDAAKKILDKANFSLISLSEISPIITSFALILKPSLKLPANPSSLVKSKVYSY